VIPEENNKTRLTFIQQVDFRIEPNEVGRESLEITGGFCGRLLTGLKLYPYKQCYDCLYVSYLKSLQNEGLHQSPVLFFNKAIKKYCQIRDDKTTKWIKHFQSTAVDIISRPNGLYCYLSSYTVFRHYIDYKWNSSLQKISRFSLEHIV
jgi:hypothetical protein